MLRKDSGNPIQGMPLGRGNATSPYTVQEGDNVVEFVDAGIVTCTYENGTTTDTNVLSGSRYGIALGVVTIDFGGTFIVG